MISITSATAKALHVFETDGQAITFPQRKAVLNFGTSTVETFGLINCLAIGGIFVNSDGDIKGSFLTHESPTDVHTLLKNNSDIKHILDGKSYTISKMVLFKIEPDGASKTKYSFNGKSLNYDELCEEVAMVCESRFGIKPIIVEYGYYCKRYMNNKSNARLHLCGIAKIDPTKDFITTYFGNTAFGGSRKNIKRRQRRKSRKSRN